MLPPRSHIRSNPNEIFLQILPDASVGNGRLLFLMSREPFTLLKTLVQKGGQRRKGGLRGAEGATCFYLFILSSYKF